MSVISSNRLWVNNKLNINFNMKWMEFYHIDWLRKCWRTYFNTEWHVDKKIYRNWWKITCQTGSRIYWWIFHAVQGQTSIYEILLLLTLYVVNVTVQIIDFPSSITLFCGKQNFSLNFSIKSYYDLIKFAWYHEISKTK